MTAIRRAATLLFLVAVGAAATGCASTGPSGGWLGVTGRTIEDDSTGLPLGVEVVEIEDDSPLAEAGVKKGDVIVTLDGAGPLSAAELVSRARAAGWERPVKVLYESGGEEREVEVVPAPGDRVFTLRFFIPFIVSWDESSGHLAFFPLTPLSVGIGPDHDGATVLGCVGWTGTPERADLWLGVFSIGTGFRGTSPPRVDAGARTEVGALPR
jgi:membrane-associated protease RseP (regulator of RpoE activity)